MKHTGSIAQFRRWKGQQKVRKLIIQRKRNKKKAEQEDKEDK